MNSRRELLNAAGAVALVAVAAPAFADESAHVHNHGGQAAPGASSNRQALVESASVCIQKGYACLSHCFETFAAGDTSMAGCARSVDQMLSVCGTLAKLASIESPYLAAMAKLALAVCLDCEKECRKHAERQQECKDCADACAKCAEACKKAAA